MRNTVTETELAVKIKLLLDEKHDAKVIDLTHHIFDRLPCSTRPWKYLDNSARQG